MSRNPLLTGPSFILTVKAFEGPFKIVEAFESSFKIVKAFESSLKPLGEQLNKLP